MSELKAHNMDDFSLHDMVNSVFYLKSEADKVIAELEESHKKEVEQLLIEIVELKETLKNSRNARKYWRKEYLIEYKKCCHQKYKRCLAMAEWCEAENYTACWYHENSERCEWTEKWHKRWLELAEKFKPNKE